MTQLKELNTYKQSPEFFENKVIKKLSENSKWTISANKMPVNLFRLKIDNMILGANINIPFSTDTLYESTKIIEDKLTMIDREPVVANNAYFLDSIIDDNLVVIDIEPECPEELKNRLLKLPYLYGEKSLSGKGIHLIIEQPKNLPKSLTEKVVIKENNKYFEILQSHWVTFTRNTIDPISNPETEENKNLLYNIYMELMNANKTYQTLKSNNNIQLADIPDITDILGHDIFAKYLTSPDINVFESTPEDYGNDLSKYEFNVMLFKYKKLKSLMNTDLIKKLNHEYSNEEIMSIMRFIAISVLEPREKHYKRITGNYDYINYISKRILEQNQS